MTVYESDVDDLLEFADGWVSLGEAVQEQVKQVLAGKHMQVNPNAIKLAFERIGGYNEEIQVALMSYLDEWRY